MRLYPMASIYLQFVSDDQAHGNFRRAVLSSHGAHLDMFSAFPHIGAETGVKEFYRTTLFLLKM